MDAVLPGFLALSDAGRGAPARQVGHTLSTWGLSAAADDVFILSGMSRTRDGAIPPLAVFAALQRDPALLTRALPPFGVLARSPGRVTALADSMGFFPLYFAHGPGGGVGVSTSATALARALSVPLDPLAVAVQSRLGWQLGQRTLFEGVEKLAPGAVLRLEGDAVRVAEGAPPPAEPVPLPVAVARSAQLLRASLERLLDEHPDAVLQLTGGGDSRLLLSAIPAARRRDVRAMTVGGPRSADVAVASALAARFGMQHAVHGAPSALGDPDAVWRRCAAAARALDSMSDPIALAAGEMTEEQFDQGVRISGLGGEVARGFYYLGRLRERPHSRRDADRLAHWRMFANEAVDEDLLENDFRQWARQSALDEVSQVLAAADDEWFHATDELYLRHRMQRWAGLTDVAVSPRRVPVNPLLDADFIDIVRGLAPRDKANSRFLGLLQMELDPELGRIPLEGRPPPAYYAHPGSGARLSQNLDTVRRLARKSLQRARHATRPGIGVPEVANAVVAQWRRSPGIVTDAGLPPWVKSEWVDGVLGGRIRPGASSVALVTNLILAQQQQGADASR